MVVDTIARINGTKSTAEMQKLLYLVRYIFDLTFGHIWLMVVVVLFSSHPVDREDGGSIPPPPFRSLGNFVHPTLLVSFGRDTKSRWSKLLR